MVSEEPKPIKENIILDQYRLTIPLRTEEINPNTRMNIAASPSDVLTSFWNACVGCVIYNFAFWKSI